MFIKQQLSDTLLSNYEAQMRRKNKEILKANQRAFSFQDQTINPQTKNDDYNHDDLSGNQETKPEEVKGTDAVSSLMNKTGLALYEEEFLPDTETKENEQKKTENVQIMKSFDLASKISKARAGLLNTLLETKKSLAAKALSLKKWRKQCYDRFAADVSPDEEVRNLFFEIFYFFRNIRSMCTFFHFNRALLQNKRNVLTRWTQIPLV